MANDIHVRVGVHNLDDAQVADFRSAYRQMMAISDNRGYQYLAGFHGAPGWYCWHHQQNARSAQRLFVFLPWHRAYLYSWELVMRDRVPGVSLPWWDWTLRPPRQNGLPEIFTARGTAREPNPLTGFRINLPDANPPVMRMTSRQPDLPDGLPSQADVEACLARSDFTDFTQALEDIHDRIHGWVSGDMGLIAASAYDPIFWSHHAMVDRIWWLWQVKNGHGNVSPDLLDVVLAPFNLKVRDVLNVNDLGYDYAAGQAVSVGGTG